MSKNTPPTTTSAAIVNCGPDTNAAVNFLCTFEPEGPWVLTAINPDRKGIETRTFGPGTENALNDWLDRFNGKRNIYFMVNPPLRALKKKGKRTDIKSVDWLHVDIDARPGEDLAREQERILRLLREPPEPIPPPTFVIFSGGGYQGFWRLEEPFHIGGDLAKAEEAARYNMSIELALGGDNCHNVDRIMRLPGTVNLPDAKKRAKGRVEALAELVENYPDRAYPISQFTPAPAVQTGEAGGLEGTTGRPVEMPANVEQLQGIDDLDQWDVPDRIKVIIVKGHHPEEGPKERDDSRSAWLFDAICGLLRYRVPDETIISVITDSNFKISESVLDKGANFANYASRQIEQGKEAVGGDTLVLDKNDPLVTAQIFVERHRPNLMHYNQDWLAFDGVAYKTLEEGTIVSELYKFLANAKQMIMEGDPKTFMPTTAKVTNVLDALEAETHKPRDIHTPPCWLVDGGLPAVEIVACRNGLLHLPSGELHPATAQFFTRNALDFDYDADAPIPAGWIEFLEQLWPRGSESINTLQEVFGYMLIPDTSQQKIFLLVGPPRSGKGTIAHVLERLVGTQNTCAPTLNGLGGNFGLEPLIGKQLATVSDMRLGRKTDQAQVTENLLRISGGDKVTADRKHRRAWDGRLAVRFLIMTNELPRFTDTSGALANRFVPLMMTKSFLGQENLGLLDEILPELPSILNWAIAGWRRLAKRGHFELPASSAEAIFELETLASPVAAFLRDKCVLKPGAMITKDKLFHAYQGWSQINGRASSGTKEVFSRDLKAATRERVRFGKPRIVGRRTQVYYGVDLLDEAGPEDQDLPF